MLRERKSKTLADMQTKAIEAEANISTSTKMKSKEENVENRMKSIE